MCKLFFIIVAAISFTWATDLIDVTIFDGKGGLDGKIREGFNHFEQQIKFSKEVKLSENPLIDYVLALSQYVKKNVNVAQALDHLLKTGGPFGLSAKEATPFQASVLRSAAQMVKKYQRGVADENQRKTTKHYEAIIEAQSKPIPTNLEYLFKVITDDKHTFFAAKRAVSYQGDTIYFCNDFWLIGFLLGEIPSLNSGLIETIWDKSKIKGEVSSEDIQWLFPLTSIDLRRDRTTPRLTSQAIDILNEHGDIRKAIQINIKKSLTLKQDFSPSHSNYVNMMRIRGCLSLFQMKDDEVGFLELLKKTLAGKYTDLLDYDLLIRNLTITQALKNTNFIGKGEALPMKSLLLLKDETVSYWGNVPPTSLYKQGKNYIFPTAPYVHRYHPDVTGDYISLAYSITPTPEIRRLFKDREIKKFFIVFQNIMGDGSSQQLLRLHGLVHGQDAASVNLSIDVKAEIIPFDNDFPISFDDGDFMKAGGVHCHDQVASPDNFALKGWNPGIFEGKPCWNSFGVYLPDSKTATLIVVGQSFFDEGLFPITGEPVLTSEAKAYIQKIMS